MTTEDTSSAAPVYDTPKVLAKSIEVTITPTYREGKLHASNATVRNQKRIDTYTVSLHVDKVPSTVKSELLGRKVDGNGVQIIKGGNIPPNVALGFACTLDDGSKELWWLYKGTFSEITKSAKTEGDAIEYQTPTIEGVFVRRMNDDALAATVETASEDIGEGVETGWFTTVYEETPAVGDRKSVQGNGASHSPEPN